MLATLELVVHPAIVWAVGSLVLGGRLMADRARTAVRRFSSFTISAVGTKDYQTPDGIRVAPALRLLSQLV